MDTLDEVRTKLAPDGLLRALSPEQLDELLQKSSRRELEQGEVIINQGDPRGDFAVYILSGGLKVSVCSASGNEIILSFCAPGELVGEIALLDRGPRTATVTASLPSSVLVVPTQAFLDVISANPKSVVRVMRQMARRMRQLNLVVESDRSFTMGPRLARALVRLIDPTRTDGRLIHDPNQSDLGAFAGLARENVSRMLAEWETQGLIERDGRAIVVRDADSLQLLADFGDEA